MNVKIKKLHPAAKIPTYGTAGAACFDLYAQVNPDLEDRHVQEVHPQDAVSFGTGVAIEVPEDHVMLIFSRSGHGWKNGVRLANCTGVIDSDYRGEIMAKLHNDSRDFALHVHDGDRIAQAMIIPVKQVTFEEVAELSSTERGVKGFGSTGN